MTIGGNLKTESHVAAKFIYLTNPRQMLVIESADLIQEFNRMKKHQQLMPIAAETIQLLPVRGMQQKPNTFITTQWEAHSKELPLMKFAGFLPPNEIVLMPPGFKPAFWMDVEAPTMEFRKHKLYWQLRAIEFWPIFSDVAAADRYLLNGADGMPLHHIAVDPNDDLFLNLYFNHTVDWKEFFTMIKNGWSTFMALFKENVYKPSEAGVVKEWADLCTENANLFIGDVLALICAEFPECADLTNGNAAVWSEAVDCCKEKIIDVFNMMERALVEA